MGGHAPKHAPEQDNIWLQDSGNATSIGDDNDAPDVMHFGMSGALHFLGITYVGSCIQLLKLGEKWRARLLGVQGAMEPGWMRGTRIQMLFAVLLNVYLCRLEAYGLSPLSAPELMHATIVVTALYGALVLCVSAASSAGLLLVSYNLSTIMAAARHVRLHACALLLLLYLSLLAAIQAGGCTVWVHGHCVALAVLGVTYMPATLGGVPAANGSSPEIKRTLRTSLLSLSLALAPVTAAYVGDISPSQLAAAISFGAVTVCLFSAMQPSTSGWGVRELGALMVSMGSQAALFLWVVYPLMVVPLLAYYGVDGAGWELPTAKLGDGWAACARSALMAYSILGLTLPGVQAASTSQSIAAAIHANSIPPAFLAVFVRAYGLLSSHDIAGITTAATAIAPVWWYQNTRLRNSLRMLSRQAMDPRHLAFEVGLCSFLVWLRNGVATTLFQLMAQPIIKFANIVQSDFLLFYAHPHAVLSFEQEAPDNVSIGIAYLVTPQDEQQQPKVMRTRSLSECLCVFWSDCLCVFGHFAFHIAVYVAHSVLDTFCVCVCVCVPTLCVAIAAGVQLQCRSHQTRARLDTEQPLELQDDQATGAGPPRGQQGLRVRLGVRVPGKHRFLQALLAAIQFLGLASHCACSTKPAPPPLPHHHHCRTCHHDQPSLPSQSSPHIPAAPADIPSLPPPHIPSLPPR